jgi:hypothetical protein
MTWQEAKQDALKLADAIGRTHSTDEVVVLVEFDSPDTHKLLRDATDDPPAWKYHLQIVRATARMLYPRGYKVRRVIVEYGEYSKWLSVSDRHHSPESLREFAASIAASR